DVPRSNLDSLLSQTNDRNQPEGKEPSSSAVSLFPPSSGNKTERQEQSGPESLPQAGGKLCRAHSHKGHTQATERCCPCPNKVGFPGEHGEFLALGIG
ncbi:hypothetical protein HispidOSU_011023, partial [Sigmodon hispidus]